MRDGENENEKSDDSYEYESNNEFYEDLDENNGYAKQLDEYNLFVRKLPPTVNDAKLTNMFSKFGEVVSAKILVNPFSVLDLNIFYLFI
jgi:RNA recognition motif-containing protein